MIFKQKPFPFSLLVLAILIALHAFGSHYSLYWAYSWFDVLVHIVSGLWVALLILWLASVFGQINSLKEYKTKSFLIALISAVLFGVVWEILENLAQLASVGQNGYSLNTALDLLNGALGAVLAYLYFVKRKKCIDEHADNLHPFYNQTGIIKS
jgi:hypothetical protein